jgi:hypothetical protein
MVRSVAIALAIVLAGCSTSLDQNLRKAVGLNIEEIIERRGNPDEVTPLQNGGNTMTWTQRWGARGEQICTVRITCDSRGIVHRYSYQNCGPEGSGYGP